MRVYFGDWVAPDMSRKGDVEGTLAWSGEVAEMGIEDEHTHHVEDE